MSELGWGEGEISLAAVASVLRQHKWSIMRSTILGGLLLGGLAFLKPALYAASASFVPQGSEGARTGLAGIAGQLGVNLGGSNQSLSPEFYRRLLQSRVLLDPIAQDTFVVAELGRKRVAVLDLFKVPSGSRQRRNELGVTRLQNIIGVSVEKSTGVVQVTATTKWPSVSLAIVTALLEGVNTYNEQMRQSQAAAERKFVEGRLNLARAELRAAEDRLTDFQKTNRSFGGSSELGLAKERLQREVSLRQEVFTSLTQAYEDARVREVRDTPVITIFEPPAVPTLPQARHRAQSVVFGLVLGFILGTLFTFASVIARRARRDGVESESAANTPRSAGTSRAGEIAARVIK